MTDQTTDVLNVEELLARCLGNVEFACRILGKFCQRCDEDLAALEEAVSSHDSESVARLAHRLKGASANASALGLQKRASDIERAARNDALDDVPSNLANLKQEWDRFNAVVSQFGTSADPLN